MNTNDRIKSFSIALTDTQMAFIESEREINKLENENEELRKLCTEMLACINAHNDHEPICSICPHYRNVDDLTSGCLINFDSEKLGIKKSGIEKIWINC